MSHRLLLLFILLAVSCVIEIFYFEDCFVCISNIQVYILNTEGLLINRLKTLYMLISFTLIHSYFKLNAQSIVDEDSDTYIKFENSIYKKPQIKKGISDYEFAI